MTETPPRKMPWSRWYFADWRADPALRMCSLAARGLWMDLLALMHESEPYGHLLIRGVQPTSKQIAALVGASEREVVALLAELAAAGVSSTTADGVRYSRRMVRDRAKERADRQNGNAGGNPDLVLGTVPKAQRARPFKRSDAPVKTDRVYQMRGGTCFWCSKRLQRQTPGHDFFHVDHYRAIRDGGTNDESNLVPACAECNHARARLPLGEDQNPANWVGVGTEADTNAGVSVGLAADRKAQKLEARSQKPDARAEERGGASPPPPLPQAPPAEPNADLKEGGNAGDQPLKPKRREAACAVTDWPGPTPEILALGASLGLTEDDVADQAARMRDWALGKDERRPRWGPTFANWLRRVADDRRGRNGAGTQNHSSGTGVSNEERRFRAGIAGLAKTLDG